MESMDKTRRSITKEIECTPDAKIFISSLGASKTLLATHILRDNGVNMVFLFPLKLIHLPTEAVKVMEEGGKINKAMKEKHA
jgi:hypothetical protein